MTSPREIAQRFVSARRDAKSLAAFPGELPTDLDSAYEVQEHALELWDEEIVGWKIGRVPDLMQQQLNADRLAGPIFNADLRHINGASAMPFPVFEHGFAAIEAEYVLRMGANAPAGKTEWTHEEAAMLVGAVHVGIETAGSPLATINDIGPLAVASDFGNNHGLILGPAILDWRQRTDADLTCEAFIDEVRVGRGGVAAIPDGPIGALSFLLAHLARRNRPLKAGQLVSTGAATGIHEIAAGQRARASFTGLTEINCTAFKAAPRATTRLKAAQN